MLEYLSTPDPRIMRRRLGAAILSGGLVVGTSACANDRGPCDRTYEITNETKMVNDRLTTPEGRVDLSFNTRGGDVVHMYFEKGKQNKDLTEAELAKRQAEFELAKTVIDVSFDDQEVTLICKPKDKSA